MLALTEKEIQSIDGMLESKMAWARSKSAEAEQLALDCTRLLSCTEERLGQIRNQGFFKRCWNQLSGQTGAMERANTADLIQMQKASLRYINMLQEQQMMTAHSLLTLKNNLVTLAIKEEETRNLVGLLAERTLQRFQDLEKRVDQLEISQNLQGWLLTLEDRDYDVNYPTPYLRMLKIIDDFYGYKSDGWNYNDMLFMRKTLRTLGLNPKEQISMNMFMDTLVEEIKKQGFDTYRELLIAHIPSDKDDFGYFAIENVSSQVFTTLNGIYTQYTDKSEVIEALSDELSISPEAALKRLLARTISKLNVDLDCQLPLSDVAAEMLVGLKLTNQLLIEDSIQEEIKEECIEQTNIECIDSDKADDIPSVQKENQFVDVMKWGEPEWNIQSIPLKHHEGYWYPEVTDIIFNNGEYVFAIHEDNTSFYRTRGFKGFTLKNSIKDIQYPVNINNIWFDLNGQKYSYDGKGFVKLKLSSCSSEDIELIDIIYDNKKWYFICTHPIDYTYTKSGILFNTEGSSCYDNSIIIESEDLKRFYIVYNFKDNDDFYRYNTKICIHNGKYIVYAEDDRDCEENFIAVSLDGENWEKVEEGLSIEFKKLFWNNTFNIVIGGKVYSSKDGKEWYSFKRDFVDGYNFDISCFKNENIIVCFNNGELYVSNDLKKVKTIKNPFDGTSPYDYSFFICNNTLIIYNKKEKKFAYWSYSK